MRLSAWWYYWTGQLSTGGPARIDFTRETLTCATMTDALAQPSMLGEAVSVAAATAEALVMPALVREAVTFAQMSGEAVYA